MSLSSDLEKLEQKKRDEIRTLHTTYLRTKRQVLRSASPARLVRRNMGISLGLAATLGLLLAPRPTHKAAAAPAAKPSRGGSAATLGWMKKMATRFCPQVAHFIPDGAPEASCSACSEKEKKEHEEFQHEVEVPRDGKTTKVKSHRLLDTLIALVLSKLDLQRILTQLAHAVMAKVRGEESEGREPHVSVADAGTIRPDTYEDFQ